MTVEFKFKAESRRRKETITVEVNCPNIDQKDLQKWVKGLTEQFRAGLSEAMK